MSTQYGCVGIFVVEGESEKHDTKHLYLKNIAVDITVRGFIANVSAKLNYVNDTKNPLEVTFKCPVDDKSAIYHFEARLDGRTIQAHCLEKKKAEKKYVKAVQSGHTAILGEEDDATSDLFHITLGNLPPGETCEMCLKFVTELPVDPDGGITFTLPTVFNPRYCPSDCQGPMPETHGTFDNIVIRAGNRYELNLSAQVYGGATKIAAVKSFTDKINVKMEDEDSFAKITLSEGMKQDHDFSFRIHYQNPHQPHLVRERGDSTATTPFMRNDVIMVSYLPELPQGSMNPHNEIIFLVDRSGSMQGDCIGYARSSLLLFLKSLPIGCRFNIVSFGSRSEKLFEGSSERYTEESLGKALKLQRKMDADFGGTEILGALRTVFSLEPTKGYARQILVLTDGEVWNVDQVLSLVRQNKDRNRVFSLGIGSGASSSLVKGMAMAGGGRSEMIRSPELMQQTVIGLLSSMLQESVLDVKVDCELDASAEKLFKIAGELSVRMVPKVPPVIFGGQHLLIYARIDQDIEVKSVTLSGQVRETPVEYKVVSDVEKIVHDESLTIHRLAAKAQIKQWQMEDAGDHRDEIVALSESTEVISKYTAFLGIDQDSKSIVKKKILKHEGSDYSYDSDDDMGCNLFDMSPPLARGQIYNEMHFLRAKCSAPRSRPTENFINLISRPRSRSRSRDAAIVAEEECDDSVLVEEMFDFCPETNPIPFCDQRSADSESGSEDSTDSAGGSDAGGGVNWGSGMSTDVVLRIAESQKFCGSWTIEDAKMRLNLDEQRWKQLVDLQNELSIEDNVMGTLLVLSLLKKSYLEREQEWRMIAEKANNFLISSGIQLETTMQKIMEILKIE